MNVMGERGAASMPSCLYRFRHRRL